MPELPEVEAARRFVNRVCAGLKITKITTTESGGGPREGLFDSLVCVTDEGTTEANLHEAFLHRTLKRVCRRGKQLWIEFSDSGPVVMFHFGMTGAIVLKGHDVPLYFSSNSKDFSQWPPRFSKLLIEFSDGTALAFRDPRRLGRIKVCSPAQLQQNIAKLGLDPTAGELPSSSAVMNMMTDLTAPIKAVLLDQERIFCGIGNYLADEILYQARIHPSSPTNALREEHVAALLEAMQHVISTAVEADADYTRFPSHWLFHSRWDKVKSKSQTVKLANGSIVVFEEVGGRTSAIVPSVQKKLTRGIVRSSKGTATIATDLSTATEVTIKTEGAKRKRPAGRNDANEVPRDSDGEVKVEKVVKQEVMTQRVVKRHKKMPAEIVVQETVVHKVVKKTSRRGQAADAAPAVDTAAAPAQLPVTRREDERLGVPQRQQRRWRSARDAGPHAASRAK